MASTLKPITLEPATRRSRRPTEELKELDEGYGSMPSVKEGDNAISSAGASMSVSTSAVDVAADPESHLDAPTDTTISPAKPPTPVQNKFKVVVAPRKRGPHPIAASEPCPPPSHLKTSEPTHGQTDASALRRKLETLVLAGKEESGGGASGKEQKGKGGGVSRSRAPSVGVEVSRSRAPSVGIEVLVPRSRAASGARSRAPSVGAEILGPRSRAPSAGGEGTTGKVGASRAASIRGASDSVSEFCNDSEYSEDSDRETVGVLWRRPPGKPMHAFLDREASIDDLPDDGLDRTAFLQTHAGPLMSAVDEVCTPGRLSRWKPVNNLKAVAEGKGGLNEVGEEEEDEDIDVWRPGWGASKLRNGVGDHLGHHSVNARAPVSAPAPKPTAPITLHLDAVAEEEEHEDDDEQSGDGSSRDTQNDGGDFEQTPQTVELDGSSTTLASTSQNSLPTIRSTAPASSRPTKHRWFPRPQQIPLLKKFYRNSTESSKTRGGGIRRWIPGFEKDRTNAVSRANTADADTTQQELLAPTSVPLTHKDAKELEEDLAERRRFESNYKVLLMAGVRFVTKTFNTTLTPRQVLKQLGSGGHSTVRLGIRQTDSHPVALKYIRSTSVWHWHPSPSSPNRIPLEIHLLRMLPPHPNIISYFEHFSFAGGAKWVIVMEYLGEEWVDLYDFVEMFGPVEESIAREVFTEVVRVVEYLHWMGYCHNDIKDENILINTTTRTIKLIDFGSATSLTAGATSTYFYGTKKFAAPEAVRGNAYYPESQEVWALGTLLYVLLFKMDPFKCEDEILDLDVGERMHALRTQGGVTVSDAAVEAIKGMLEKDWSRRIRVGEILKLPFFGASGVFA
ncbi:hypothetical protein HK104_005772 [Borealophlyctis nickersoniae]|nr:hypothetical protein HK104_005772 [Borealophlyctis nickersoniae]